MQRIVITGLGAISPLGVGAEVNWQRLLQGQSGLRRLPEAVVEGIACKIAAPVPGLADDPEGGFDPDLYRTGPARSACTADAQFDLA